MNYKRISVGFRVFSCVILLMPLTGCKAHRTATAESHAEIRHAERSEASLSTAITAIERLALAIEGIELTMTADSITADGTAHNPKLTLTAQRVEATHERTDSMAIEARATAERADTATISESKTTSTETRPPTLPGLWVWIAAILAAPALAWLLRRLKR